MSTLLEIQRAVRDSLVDGDSTAAAEYVVADGLAPEARLDIYRNTFVGCLTAALRLSFPAVQRLVGGPFFESAARLFIEADPPRSAWLDAYGDRFPEFLAGFEPAAGLPYLPGVARLEWAVSRALHAPDSIPLDITSLAEIDPADHGRVAFVPHPGIGLVQAGHPVDAIWRAVLEEDEGALERIDPDAGEIWLIVQRTEKGPEVMRIDEQAWRFTADLFASRPLQDTINAHPGAQADVLLADHLAAGRFVAFSLSPPNSVAMAEETPQCQTET